MDTLRPQQLVRFGALVAPLFMFPTGCSESAPASHARDGGAPNGGSPDGAPGGRDGGSDSGEPMRDSEAEAEDASVFVDGGATCEEGWTTEGEGCVPVCKPLPESFVDVVAPPAEPPFGNTVWFDPDIITEADPSSFVELTAQGQGQRDMFDRRTNSFITVEAHLFLARFGASIEVEVQVNPEFDVVEAEREARRHALAIGRIPAFLFAELKTVWLHRGKELFGGGNQNLLIHTEQTADYEADGVLEEVFVHEGTHTSLDGLHASAPNWLAAQAADGIAISPYALENPTREDLSEFVGPYLAARYRPERLDPGVADKLLTSLPNRVLYFDCLGLSMEPPR